MGRHPHTPVKRWLVDIVLLGQSWSAFYHPPQRNSYGSNALSAASRPASKACYQHANHCQLDERFAGLHLPLVVFAHSAAPRDPRKRAFHHPPFRLRAESAHTRGTLDHFELPPTLLLTPLSQLLATVRRV